MKFNASMIQKITSILIFVVGFVFAILGLFGVQVSVNQQDVNNIIFGLSSIIAALIQFGPMIFGLVKDKNFKDLFLIVRDVVYAVEELSGMTGSEKKAKALKSIAKICEEKGIEFDEEKISSMIESVVAIRNIVVKDKV